MKLRGGFFRPAFAAMAGMAALLGTSGISAAADSPVFPLRPDITNRYLIDQNNVPFLMVGDSPQA